MAQPIAVKITQVQQLGRELERVITNTKKRGVDNLTTDYLQARLSKANVLWEKISTTNAEIVCSITPEQAESFEYIKLNQFNHYESVFDETEEYLFRMLDKVKRVEVNKASGDQSQSKPQSSSVHVKLPLMDLPKFGGDYTQWVSFSDIFRSVIHENETLSKVQKFQYLRSCLTGEADSLIQVLPLSDENYESAWGMLESRYQNPRLIVTSLCNRLFGLKSVNHDRLSEIKTFKCSYTLLIESLKAAGQKIDPTDPLLIHLLASKLDHTLRHDWEATLGGSTELPDLNSFNDYLEEQINTLEAMALSTKSVQPSRNKVSLNVVESSKSSSSRSCSYCSKEHLTFACPEFNALSQPERFNAVKKRNMCWNCLCTGHSVKTCRSKHKCRKCGKPHHTLLHSEKQQQYSAAPKRNVSQDQPGPSAKTTGDLQVHMGVSTPITILLATAIVRLRAANGHELKCRALIDPGSQTTFVSEFVSQKLKLVRTRADVSVSGLGGDKQFVARHLVELDILPHFEDDFTLHARALVLQRITSYKPPSMQTKNLIFDQKFILADPDFHKYDHIDMLLGADLYSSIVKPGIEFLNGGKLVAQHTALGWTISGAVTAQTTQTVVANHIITDPLDKILRAFWELEEVPTQVPYNEEDKFTEDLFKTSTIRDESGRFIVRLPFKPNCNLKLGNTFCRATHTLRSLQARLAKNSTLNKMYTEFMDEYIQLGHMTKIQTNTPNSILLPHHGVLREDHITTKLRVVFNASSPSSTGVSLNDVLCIGPKLQTDLGGVLMRWRLHRFVLTADIEKMFRQILVAQQDRSFQCILWQSKSDTKPCTYALNTVTYGTAPAPFLALRVIREIANLTENEWPLASDILRKNIYVDDVLFGAEDIALVQQMKQQVNSALSSGGFNLRKWRSNNSILVQDQPTFETESNTSLKLLGLTWNSDSDTLKLTIPSLNSNANTKRAILSSIASIFDPLGFLSPVIVRAKILLQSLWLVKLDWDTILPDDVVQQWQRLAVETTFLETLEVPRWTGLGSHCIQTHLVGFCDASKSAYSAVVYLVTFRGEAGISTTLIMAKSKVAPIKTVSIPRLELCGAVLLKNLINFVRGELAISIDSVKCFTDSSIVLAWLRKTPGHWTTFVSNRISAIQTELADASWAHVKSRDNPADLNSRGTSTKDLAESSLWWNGPEWLSQSTWTANTAQDSFETTEECKASASHNIVENTPGFDYAYLRISNWSKLNRIFAYVNRFIRRIGSDRVQSPPTFLVTADELQRAEILILKDLQYCQFRQEIDELKSEKRVSKTSKLVRFQPFLDADSVVRLGGRLKYSELNNSVKSPVLLDTGYVSDLLIKRAHIETLHGGTQLTLRVLREKYWIFNARKSTKRIISACVLCAKANAKLATQEMSDLPSVRCTPARPFSRVGVDYAGPFTLRFSPGRGSKSTKGWIAVFVCMVTKAIHLEVVQDCSTVTFLAALDRFTSRRGVPADVYSDNGTNFQGAHSAMQAIFVACTRDEAMQQKYADLGMKWHFIPPSAPHFGGLWEAAVKSMKGHLKKQLTKLTPTFEELSTLTCQIEACLNSRPLCPLNDDPESFDALTPGHFLVGTSLKTPPSLVIHDTKPSMIKKWRQWHNLAERLWHAWQRDYLHSLQVRHKWLHPSANVEIGNLVSLKMPNSAPLQWPLGRIVNTYPSRDGRIRVVAVKTATTTLTRPIHSICPLPSSKPTA